MARRHRESSLPYRSTFFAPRWLFCVPVLSTPKRHGPVFLRLLALNGFYVLSSGSSAGECVLGRFLPHWIGRYLGIPHLPELTLASTFEAGRKEGIELSNTEAVSAELLYHVTDLRLDDEQLGICVEWRPLYSLNNSTPVTALARSAEAADINEIGTRGI
ncbi:hypothetical protein EXIGLDRAFT_729779 [Exidia glandulosa HHB12029]|uniref:Uncharacterized protein n=1 Tax=Exidia glandulosa HHB12029 TaxID=1314781 RepID=A0A165CG20_EXIGL|nr:hypothetical protein EXIGLDRAFT_729779 [Exidia glandulosa HHB12029]